jgi:hypothetical protein
VSGFRSHRGLASSNVIPLLASSSVLKASSDLELVQLAYISRQPRQRFLSPRRIFAQGPSDAITSSLKTPFGFAPLFPSSRHILSYSAYSSFNVTTPVSKVM